MKAFYAHPPLTLTPTLHCCSHHHHTLPPHTMFVLWHQPSCFRVRATAADHKLSVLPSSHLHLHILYHALPVLRTHLHLAVVMFQTLSLHAHKGPTTPAVPHSPFPPVHLHRSLPSSPLFHNMLLRRFYLVLAQCRAALNFTHYNLLRMPSTPVSTMLPTLRFHPHFPPLHMFLLICVRVLLVPKAPLTL